MTFLKSSLFCVNITKTNILQRVMMNDQMKHRCSKAVCLDME
jgi:hypothetical protein